MLAAHSCLQQSLMIICSLWNTLLSQCCIPSICSLECEEGKSKKPTVWCTSSRMAFSTPSQAPLRWLKHGVQPITQTTKTPAAQWNEMASEGHFAAYYQCDLKSSLNLRPISSSVKQSQQVTEPRAESKTPGSHSEAIPHEPQALP